jgi:hypothetical protein
LLFHIEDISVVKKKLELDLFYKQGGYQDHVVVRTDAVMQLQGDELVDGAYNLVIPIDAKDVSEFNAVWARLRDLLQPTAELPLIVTMHWPDVPHDSNGFVTYREVFASPHPEIKGGRIHHSPGANPWG